MGGAGRIDDDNGFFFDQRTKRCVDVETILDPPRAQGTGARRGKVSGAQTAWTATKNQASTRAGIRQPGFDGAPFDLSNTNAQNWASRPNAPRPTNVKSRSIGKVAQTGIAAKSMPAAQKRASRSRLSRGARRMKSRPIEPTASHQNRARKRGRSSTAVSAGIGPHWPKRMRGRARTRPRRKAQGPSAGRRRDPCCGRRNPTKRGEPARQEPLRHRGPSPGSRATGPSGRRRTHRLQDRHTCRCLPPWRRVRCRVRAAPGTPIGASPRAAIGRERQGPRSRRSPLRKYCDWQ